MDRDSVMDALAEEGARRGRVVDCLIQVNLSNEPTKGGYAMADAEDALRRARELCLAGPYFKGGPSRHRTKWGRLALARALKEARWAFTACARIVLINRDQLARAHAEAERRNGWEDHLQAQRGIVA